MIQIQAGTVAWLPIEFFDKNNDAVTPASISYTVYDQTTGAVVSGPTAVSAASSVEIELDATDTAMQSPTNDVETRKVCVTSTFGAGDSRVDIYRFEVLRPEGCS